MQKALKEYNKGGEKALNAYVDSLPPNIDIESIDGYIEKYGERPWWDKIFSASK